MMVRIIVVQLLILCFGPANLLPLSIPSDQETRIFRWTTTVDLQDTSCAIGLDLKEIYNYTGRNSELENYISKNDIPFVFLNHKIVCDI